MNYSLDRVGAKRLARDLTYFNGKIWLAGGAPRNDATGRLIKDFDLFVDRDSLTIDEISSYFGGCEFIPLSECEGQPEESYAEAASHLDIDVWRCADLHIDLIYCDDPRKQIDLFPDNLSRMWYNDDGGIEYSGAAYTDYLHKRVTYRTDWMQKKRLARLKELYPTWTFVPHNPLKIITSTKKEAELAPFWWEDFNGRKGRQINTQAAWEATRLAAIGEPGARL